MRGVFTHPYTRTGTHTDAHAHAHAHARTAARQALMHTVMVRMFCRNVSTYTYTLHNADVVDNLLTTILIRPYSVPALRVLGPSRRHQDRWHRHSRRGMGSCSTIVQRVYTHAHTHARTHTRSHTHAHSFNTHTHTPRTNTPHTNTPHTNTHTHNTNASTAALAHIPMADTHAQARTTASTRDKRGIEIYDTDWIAFALPLEVRARA